MKGSTWRLLTIARQYIQRQLRLAIPPASAARSCRDDPSDVPGEPQHQEALQLQPVEVRGGDDVAGQVLELVAFDAVVFGLGIAAFGQQRRFGVEVRARQRLQLVEALVEGLVAGFAGRGAGSRSARWLQRCSSCRCWASISSWPTM
jgi:hypothetical protein